MIIYSEDEIYDLLDTVNCIRDIREIYDFMKDHKYAYSQMAWQHMAGTLKLFEDLFNNR